MAELYRLGNRAPVPHHFAAGPRSISSDGAGLNLPAKDAQKAIEHLSHWSLRPSADIAEVRRRYSESRRALLAPLEPVESVFHLLPQAGTTPPLTVIRPKTFVADKPSPALVFLHGGGWTVGTFEIYEPLCRQLANALDHVVVWVDYRLAPEHPFPAAFDDTRNVLRWLPKYAARLGIDPERIGIGGDSAGGNLAAAACLAELDERSSVKPRFQLLIYPCLDQLASMNSHKIFANGFLLTADLYSWYRRNYLNGYVKPGHWRLSPLFAHDVTGLPPAIILYAGFDPLSDEAAAYASRLEAAGVPVRTLFFSDMIHGFMTMGGAIAAAEAGVRQIAEALGDLAVGDGQAST